VSADDSAGAFWVFAVVFGVETASSERAVCVYSPLIVSEFSEQFR
jgi:hypothetical protein